jgi:hypothetical protein
MVKKRKKGRCKITHADYLIQNGSEREREVNKER